MDTNDLYRQLQRLSEEFREFQDKLGGERLTRIKSLEEQVENLQRENKQKTQAISDLSAKVENLSIRAAGVLRPSQQ
jgi:archaellum component FlaC